MADRTIEAKLVISGESKGATDAINKIVKAYKEAEKASEFSGKVQRLAESYQGVEKAMKAAAQAAGAQKGYEAADAQLKRSQVTLQQYGKELEAARKAKAAFDGVKLARGSAEAKVYADTAKALKDTTALYNRAEREVKKLTGAVSQQESAFTRARAAAEAHGVPMKSLEQHQRALRQQIDATTQALGRQAAAEERSAQISSNRRTAMKAIASGAGIYVGHKAGEARREVVHTYREFDKERRFGKAVMGLSDEEQKPLVDQAIKLGATTKFNDIQVLEAQRELAARGLKKEQVLGLIKPASDLGMALDLKLPDAVKQMEGAIFGFKKDISTTAAAMASARQTADVQVKAAKISGMTPEDITQAYKYGATPARLSGLSEQTLLAFAGISKKANMGGDESGVAFRALVAATTKPTRGAKEAMLANGLDFKNYQKNPDSLALDPFVKAVAAQYGVKLNRDARRGLGRIFSDKALIADPAKFTPAVMDMLGDTLGDDDAKSKKSIAGLANRFRDASMKGTDTNAMVADLLRKIPGNLALSNAIFGAKQGGRIATALGDPATFKHMLDELLKHSEGYAPKIAGERMAGFDGAMSRLEGSRKNAETAMGRAWDDDGKGGMMTKAVDTIASLVQHFAELDKTTLQAVSAITYLGGKATEAGGTFGLAYAALRLNSSATALSAAATRLGAPGIPAGPLGPVAGKTPFLPLAAGVTGLLAAGTLAYMAGGKHQPEEAVKLRERLVDLNKKLERQGEAAGRFPVDDPARAAADAKIKQTQTEIEKVKADLERVMSQAGKEGGAAAAEGYKAAPHSDAGTKAGAATGSAFLAAMAKVLPMAYGGGEGFGGGGGGGLIHRASLGSGGGRSGPAPDYGGGAGGAGGSWTDAVMRAEGTAGKDPYNVVLGNGKYGLPSKPLTEMSLREAYAFGRTVRARHGSSSALGAFQIVGRTMKSHMGHVGLGWDDKFSPENQRKLADSIRRREGWGAWEGFKSHPGELQRARRGVNFPGPVPEKPPSAGGSTQRASAEDRLHAFADRLENTSIGGRVMLEVADRESRLRVTRMQGDVGLSMPHLERRTG